MKPQELKDILIKYKYDLNKTSAEIGIDINDLKDLITKYDLKPKKESFRHDVLENMESFIDEKYTIAKVIKSDLIKQIQDKKLSVIDTQFISGMKYYDDIIKECFSLSEKYKINNKKTIQ